MICNVNDLYHIHSRGLQVPGEMLRQIRFLYDAEVKRLNPKSVQKAIKQMQNQLMTEGTYTSRATVSLLYNHVTSEGGGTNSSHCGDVGGACVASCCTVLCWSVFNYHTPHSLLPVGQLSNCYYMYMYIHVHVLLPVPSLP